MTTDASHTPGRVMDDSDIGLDPQLVLLAINPIDLFLLRQAEEERRAEKLLTGQEE